MKNTKETVVLMLCLSLIFSPSAVFAAPQGGKVVGGSANIQQSGATTTINQSSDRAIINWHSFDIGKNEAVRHNMPSRNSAGLHRVVGGGGASQIQGLLQSNGNVYLVNPAGVVIHKGARVDTNSFIATTRDIADSNFMKGKMVFDRPGRPDAQIINQGTISVKESGLAALVAPTVRNEGLIAGKLGKVALASGDATWKLDMHGDDLITFTVDENDVNALHATDGTPLAGVENSGSIKAEGGVVVLTAAQLDGIVGSVVNSGEVSAASVELKGGKITFRGQGSQVDVCNTGTVDASSAKADGGAVRMTADGAVASSGTVTATGGKKGGTAVLTGREVALTGTAKIDVSGNTGGGTALVGGNALGKGPERNAKTTRVESGAAIQADAKVKGDGGQVVVWSDEKTNFDGTITARGGSEGGNGGQVETSGKTLKVGENAKVDTSANKGVHGQWLLDPVDFVIAASGGDITGATVSANLASNNVTIKSDDVTTGTSGDINVNDSVSWSADTTLTLNAHRNVNVNAEITATGDNAGLTITPKNGIFNLIGSKITLSGDNPSLIIDSQTYTVINSIQDLQSMNDNLSGFYALGSDIDAYSTSSWNNGEGFDPIGGGSSVNLYFQGRFDGLGHEIKGLTINRPDESGVGLFGSILDGAFIQNVHLNDMNINGQFWVGGLVGEMYGNQTDASMSLSTIRNVTSSGRVEGWADVGGIIGRNFGKIYNSSTRAKVFLRNAYGGGFVGTNYGFISSSSSLGSVHGSMVGGFVGENDGIIENSYASVEIFPNSGATAGGFAGSVIQGSLISNSYSSSKINGNGGGFIGSFNPIDGSINLEAVNCYWDKTIIGSFVNDGVGIVWPAGSLWDKELELISLTTEQMRSEESFKNWNFDTIWAIDEGKSYPYLRSIAANIPSTDPEPTPGTGGGTTAPDPAPKPDPKPDPGSDPDQNKPTIPNISVNKPNNNSQSNAGNAAGNAIEKEGKNFWEQLVNGFFPQSKTDINIEKFSESKITIDELQNLLIEDLVSDFEKIETGDIKKALKDLKKNIHTTSMDFSTESQNPPDAVYDAFAQFIYEIADESKISMYADNINKFVDQLYKSVKAGVKSTTKTRTIDGVEYEIEFDSNMPMGKGFALCTIKWTKSGGMTHTVRLYYVSSLEETMQTVVEFLAACGVINKKAWEDASKNLISATMGPMTTTVINALCGDSKSINTVLNKLGADFKKEVNDNYDGSFARFVKETLPNGEKLASAAQKIQYILTKHEEIIQLAKAGKEYAEELNDYRQICKDLGKTYPSDGVKSLVTQLLADLK